MAALAQPQASAEVPLLMQVVVAVVFTKLPVLQELVGRAAVALEMAHQETLERPTPEAVVVVAVVQLAHPAAPASSSSSTPYPYSLS
jgi:hypothetical protein